MPQDFIVPSNPPPKQAIRVTTIVFIALAGLIDIAMSAVYAPLSLDNIDAQWQLAFLPIPLALLFGLIALGFSIFMRPFSKLLFMLSLLVIVIPTLIVVAVQNYFFLR